MKVKRRMEGVISRIVATVTWKKRNGEVGEAEGRAGLISIFPSRASAITKEKHT